VRSSCQPQTRSAAGEVCDVVVVSPTHREGLDALLSPQIGERVRLLAARRECGDSLEARMILAYGVV
jgi:hypothetical protein